VGKNTVFEVANNSPLMIRVPGVTDKGMVTDKLVELVDVFPTLADLSGLPPLSRCPRPHQSRRIRLCTEGSSLVPLLQDPKTPDWKDSAFFQYPHYRGFANAFCMGYTIRTEQYRFTEWVHYDYDLNEPTDWERICARELYDHDKDPYEKYNLAYDREYSAVKDTLSLKLRGGWRKAAEHAS
jgi:iduronate 2-sulfatase